MPQSPARRAAPGPIGTLHVPYIASWSAERTAQPEVVMRRGRLAYRDERPYDRDTAGILWHRMPSRPGRGRPQHGKVHFLRQRRAMEAQLCQVCGLPAAQDATDDGLAARSGDRASPGVPALRLAVGAGVSVSAQEVCGGARTPVQSQRCARPASRAEPPASRSAGRGWPGLR